MDRLASRDELRLAEGPRERRVGMDRGDDVVDGRLEADREGRLRDQLARLRTHDVRAADPAVRAGGHELHAAVALADRQRAARGLEIEASRPRAGALLPPRPPGAPGG